MRAALETTPLIDYIPQRAAKPIFLSLVEFVVMPPPQPRYIRHDGVFHQNRFSRSDHRRRSV